MRFVCESCRAQYMINDEKVGPKGVKVRCRKCGYVILVKRADAAKGPVAMSNDPDDALATQVMQTPLAAAEATLSNDDHPHAEEMTNPGTATATTSPTLQQAGASAPTGSSKDSFFGADEDEIGAVFDQVLKGTGSHSAHKPSVEGGSPDDRQSTRVIDADTVRKLAEESNGKERAPEPKVEEVPQTEWYVAINEKQTGPLTLEKVKEHWDRGEISPDSLCWRAGYDDWIPVSDVKMLNAVLAPKPPKPIVVAAAVTVTQSGPAVMNVPVQSAFSSGGMVSTVQSQMQVPMSGGGMGNPEETGSWKPSAANSLGSLLKDEMEAQSRPPPKPPPPVVEDPQVRGLLDVPHHEEKATNGATVLPMPIEHRESERPQRPAPPPPNPYLQNPGATYSAPAMTQYRPPNNRNLMIGVAAGGGVMLLILVGLIVWLATRQPQQLAIAPTPPVVVAAVPVAVAVTPTPMPTPVPVAVAPTPTPTPVPVAVAPPTPAPVQPKGGTGNRNPKVITPKPEREPAPTPEPRETKTSKPAASSEEDDFAKEFGGDVKKPSKEETSAKSEKKPPGYIPPAPGSSTVEVKESLGQGDIMEVVLNNKAALGKCVEQQRKADPGTSGKLLMKWTIQTSGKTSNVSVASDEFKGTVIANCVGGLIKGMQFPKSKKQGEPITFPFKF